MDLSRNHAVEKPPEKRRGAKAAENRGVKPVTDNAPFGDRILKSRSLRLSAFSVSLRLFHPIPTASFRLSDRLKKVASAILADEPWLPARRIGVDMDENPGKSKAFRPATLFSGRQDAALLYLLFCPAWRACESKPSWGGLPACRREGHGARGNVRPQHTRQRDA